MNHIWKNQLKFLVLLSFGLLLLIIYYFAIFKPIFIYRELIKPKNELYCHFLNSSDILPDIQDRSYTYYLLRGKTLLLNIIHDFKRIIENKETNARTWREKDDAWRRITNASTTESCYRTKDALKKYYDNIKKMIRKEVADEKKEINKTEGGILKSKEDPVKDLTLSIMNKKTVFGLKNDLDGDHIELKDVSSCSTINNNDYYIEMHNDGNLASTSSILPETEEDGYKNNHTYVAPTKINEESSICSSVVGVQASERVFSWHVATPKTECLKHAWTKRRRPSPQVTSTKVLQESTELAKIKKDCFETEKIYLLDRRKQDQAVFALKKEKLLLDFKIKKLKLKKYDNNF